MSTSFGPDHYDEAYYAENGQAGDRPALRWYVKMVLRYVGRGPYLDFGCGTGHLVRRLAEHGPASGVEVSAWSAETARRTAPGCPVYTSPEDLPTDGYRGLTAIHVLEHLDDDTAAAAVETWRRVLVPGGRALVAMPDPAGRGHALAGERWNGFADPTHVNLKSHEEWRKFLVHGGFTIVREGSDGLWDVPYGRLPRFLDLRAVPSFVQFCSGRLFLNPGEGESSIFVVENTAT